MFSYKLNYCYLSSQTWTRYGESLLVLQYKFQSLDCFWSKSRVFVSIKALKVGLHLCWFCLAIYGEKWTAHASEWGSRSWSEARLHVLHIHTNASWDHDLCKPTSCVTLSCSAISQLLSLHKSWISDIVHCFQSCEEYCYLWSSPWVGPLNAFGGCMVILPCWAKVTNLRKWECSSLKTTIKCA